MVAFILPDTREQSPRIAPGLVFTVLGSVRAWRDGMELDLGSPQQRLTLAVLLLARGRVVPVSEIITALWAGQEPLSARGTVRTYIHRLRRVLAGNAEAESLDSAGNGYRLRFEDQSLDLCRFLAGRHAAAEARANGDTRRAADLLRAALQEWRDDPLAGLPASDWAESERRRIRYLGVQTAESLAELEIEFDLGDRAEIAERLASLAKAEPLRERAHELLILALYQSGRTAEALTAFDRIRRTLRDELGVEPGPALRDLHERILRSDTALLSSTPTPTTPPTPALARPAQLPAALPVFSGRRTELHDLTTRLNTRPAPGVIVVHGTAGVGKTAFAVHWANRASPSYPDGQLYVNLRGFEAGGVARQPQEVLGELLDALGVPSADRPRGLDALTALYRTALANRRVLVLLDNARNDTQVLPLLPGGTHSLALITSRLELAGLVAVTGAHTIKLDLLDDQESADLMALRLGAQRVADEPGAVQEIAAACARLPLALAVVCARIASNQQLTLSDAAHELAHRSRNRLDALGAADTGADLRSLLSWSYHALTPQAARLFRLLSLMPAAEFTLEAAASLTGLPIRHATATMRELTTACLVTPQRGRYSWHDLLHEYAEELLEETDGPGETQAAHRRLFDHYLVLTRAGSMAMEANYDDRPQPLEIVTGVLPSPMFDERSAAAMFTAECETVLTLVQRACALGFAQHAWHLIWYLRRYLDWAGRVDDLATYHGIALQAAERTGDHHGIGYAHRGLARAAWWRGQVDECLDHLDRAVSAYAETGDRLAQFYTQRQAIGVLIFDHRNDVALERIEHTRTLLRAEGRTDLEGTLLTLTARYLLEAGSDREAIAAAHVAREHNEAMGYKDDLLQVLDMLSQAHAKLGEYAEAIEFHEELLKLQGDSDEFIGPQYTNSRRWQLTEDLAGFVRLLVGDGQHERAEATQREVLRRLRNELTDPRPVPGAIGHTDHDVHAALVVLDALIAAEHADSEWYAACEAIVHQAKEVADSTGPARRAPRPRSFRDSAR